MKHSKIITVKCTVIVALCATMTLGCYLYSTFKNPDTNHSTIINHTTIINYYPQKQQY